MSLHPSPRVARLAVTALLLPVAGCLSDLVPGEPPLVRYFSAAAPLGALSVQPETAPALRMRRVSSAAHLRERMVWRISEVEYGFYETRRWTEQPVAWLERALEQELFEARGMTRSSAFDVPVLDVHLIGFEEVLEPDHHARVAVIVHLFAPEGGAWVERTLEASEPITGSDPEQFAEAASSALAAVVRDAAAAVARPLADPPR